ncbi:hypothetical protein FHX64_001992 [Microbacter margulisiae]|uniref:Uncharacterized protein n=1 Tax=Microbacter margulisiae TaxID=1350067 RepID=A0A7W5DSJ2_9PORP|nr:hypothetical protein [Microbacter margulisiae]
MNMFVEKKSQTFTGIINDIRQISVYVRDQKIFQRLKGAD